MYKETEEDTSTYKECFLDLMVDNTPKIMKIVNKHLAAVMFNWINQFGACKSPKSEHDDKNRSDSPFQPADQGSSKKPVSMKKRQNIMISQIKEDCSEDDKIIRPNIFITDESSLELVYTDLLENLIIFVQNVADQEGMWREHLLLLENIERIVHLFYMPEIHNNLVPTLKTFAISGNNHLRN